MPKSPAALGTGGRSKGLLRVAESLFPRPYPVSDRKYVWRPAGIRRRSGMRGLQARKHPE